MAVSSTGTDIPRELIWGHSFVRRLRSDLHARFDQRAAKNFDLQGTAEIFMHGVGGRTAPRLRQMDMGVITRISPDIVILDIETNDLSLAPPEVVGSDIEELVRSLIAEYSVRAVVLCKVTPRATNKSSNFNERVKLLNQYTRVMIDPIEQAICWTHRGFSNPSVTSFLSEGVHFNPMGQYTLYMHA